MAEQGEHDHDTAIEQARQELQQLQELGAASRRRRLGEIETLTDTKNDQLSKWKKACQKRPLHQYVQAVKEESHLVPSKILSQQAKLSQCLHLMEVFLQQKNLVEKQNRAYAGLVAQQVAQEEEERSQVTLEIMNELCRQDVEIRALQEEMRNLGFSFQQDIQDDEQEEEQVVEHDEHNDGTHGDDKSNDSAVLETPTTNEHRPWWWPIQDSSEKQKPPLSGSEQASVCSDASSKGTMNPIALLWTPAKFKDVDISLHTTPDYENDDRCNNGSGSSKPTLDGSTHSDSDKSLASDVSYEHTKTVARQWWPAKPPSPTQEAAEVNPASQEESTQKQKHWWDSFAVHNNNNGDHDHTQKQGWWH